MSSTEVTDLLVALAAGSVSLDEVARRFREREWPEAGVPETRTYLELAAAAQQDPEPDVSGSFDDVLTAYDRGEITWEQYRTLAHAAADAINAEAAREEANGPGRSAT